MTLSRLTAWILAPAALWWAIGGDGALAKPVILHRAASGLPDPDPEPGDTTPPTFQSATVAGNGTTLTIDWSENVTGSSGLSLSASGGVAVLTYASGSGTSAYTYSIHRPILTGETVTLSAASSNIKDAANNSLANFSGATVTNNSTAEGGSGESLRPNIFPAIPGEATAAGFAPNDLSTSVRTDVTPTTRGGVVEIAGGTYSSPYTASTANRTYRLMGNVTYENAGILINANNITLDLNGYTLTYKTVGPASVQTGTVVTASDPNWPTITQTGLTLTSNSHWTFVVEFLTGAEAGNHYEVRDNTSETITLENHSSSNHSSWENGGPSPGDTFRIYDARLTYGVRHNDRTGIELVNGSIVEGNGWGRGSSSRAGRGCNPVYFDGGSAMVGGVSATWHADNALGILATGTVKYCEADDQGTLITERQRTIGAISLGTGSTAQYCRIINGRHANVVVSSNSTVEYCEIYGDTRGTNAYGVGTYGGQGNVFRYNNIYKTGEHAMCMALLSNPAQNNEVYGNWCEAKATRSSAEYGWNYAVGLTDRWDNGGRTLSNHIHDNSFITYSEDGSGPNEESRGRTLWMASLDTAVGEVVEDNFIGAYSTDNETECHTVGLVLHNSNLILRNNILVGQQDILWLHDRFYGDALAGGRLIGNTFIKVGSDPNFATIRMGGYRKSNVDLISNTFGPGTSATDIGAPLTNVGDGPADADNTIRDGYLLTVTVTESAVPVSGATVAVKDKDGATLRSGFTTNGSGVVVVDVPVSRRTGPSFTPVTLAPLTVEAGKGASTGSNTISPTGDDSISVGISP